MTNSLSSAQSTQDWMAKWCPEPKEKNLRTQFGVHLEEFAETLEQISSPNPQDQMLLGYLTQAIKQAGEHFKKSDGVLIIKDRIEFLDGLCDTMVTSIGLGHMARMDVAGGFAEVNRSNWSKFDENGNPVLDENLKLVKGSNYSKPELKTFI